MALNYKLQAFVDVYAGDTNEAARIAGITEQYGRLLMVSLNSPSARPIAKEVQNAIRQRQSTVLAPDIADREHRQRFWSDSMNNGDLPMSDRLRASELLGKSEADFIDVVRSSESMLLVLGSPRKQIESTVIERKADVQGQAEAEGSEPGANEEDASKGHGAAD